MAVTTNGSKCASFFGPSDLVTRRLCIVGSTEHLTCHIKVRNRLLSQSVMELSLFRSDRPGDDDSKNSNLYGPSAAYMPLDDVMMYDQPITCDPDFPCFTDEDDYDAINSNRLNDVRSLLLVGVPILAPIVAFFTFESFAEGYSSFNDFLSRSNNWVAVDGGAYQARIIAPAINGLVVPAVALLFATLISTTITTLRQRQVEIRRAINMEAGELRAMECLLDAIDPGFVQDQCRSYVRFLCLWYYLVCCRIVLEEFLKCFCLLPPFLLYQKLIQYTSRILSECHPRLGAGANVINPRRGFDSELNGLTRQFNMAHGKVIPAHVADELYSSVTRLREQRINRITALQSIYPPLHYAILVVLASAECIAYLIETDQELLVFLNAVQLKLLWSMLVGTFVACFAVVIDLRTPFTGSYQISASVDQLHIIKLTLQASCLLAAQKKQQQVLANQESHISKVTQEDSSGLEIEVNGSVIENQ
jgi:Protein of unknown function (DUF4239)